jgi:8-oxo-dGTP pyrophosphatase MutT (NUDIX family)
LWQSGSTQNGLDQTLLSQIILTRTVVATYYTSVHNIQRKILGKLLYAETLGYAQMRPPGVESNHFAYHLEQLVRSGLVAKTDRRYTLTPSGLSWVDRMSQEKMVDRLQPHVVTAIDITDEQGRTLLFKRSFQPYIYRIGFPLGKTHYEESTTQAAARELQEKTGLTDIPLQHRGIAYIEATMRGATISKVLYHIFQGKAGSGLPLATPTHRGECFWGDDKAYKQKELMPGFQKIKTLLHGEQPLFFTEISEEL